MSRKRRIFIPGISVHVIHRGHNLMSIYRKDTDYELFLRLLRRAGRRRKVAIHGYVLMTTHVHLVVTPATADALSCAMKDLAGGYVRYFNREYQRRGTLWNGPYRALHIENERYWLTCLRYVEQNPVRAGMVSAAEEYRWSSYNHHAVSGWDDWLAPHYVYQSLGRTDAERRAAYHAICEIPVPPADAELFRCQTGV